MTVAERASRAIFDHFEMAVIELGSESQNERNLRRAVFSRADVLGQHRGAPAPLPPERNRYRYPSDIGPDDCRSHFGSDFRMGKARGRCWRGYFGAAAEFAYFLCVL